ncbi:MAG TPA: winged helix-turn-helix domain-containing protein [Candidatus Omnitrophota bacterium]|nr:winged helix-turn-helix domain-containing protein [Candidatus Omnitrophota bacterium]
MITRIGLVAGDIWNYLDNHGGTAGMDELIRAVAKDSSIVLMSIGWLAREGHVVLEGDGPAYTIRLTRQVV